ncbi:hypothetical protein LJR129_000158 [Acidovorax sp. LjRoot129]|uniref:hypothetical protein n=1 Tax=Acidovorax sp. LjRoot129 TaxID=3342260 RepID=UPI003ECE67B8
MLYLISAWPVLALTLPALWLLSAVFFLVKGNRRALGMLMALAACFLIGALLMEFFVFMGARMAPPGRAQSVPELGTGTRQLLQTMANPRSIAAPPLSLAAVAAYSVLLSYGWILVAWVLHLRGGGSGGSAKKKKPAKGGRKSARA